MVDMPLSLYECDTEEDVCVVALALSARRDEDRKFHYIRLTQDDLGPLLTKLVRTPGDTPVKRANDRHWELTVAPDEIEAVALRVAARARVENRRISDAIRGKELRRLAKTLNDQLLLGLPDCWLLH